MKKITRYIIALDADGTWHVRKTICVTHDATTGEVRYDAKPIPLGRAPRYIQDAVDTLQTHLEITRKRH